MTESDCCSPGPTADSDVLQGLAELLRRYDVNDYAASVQVYAVKARDQESGVSQKASSDS